MISAVIGPKSEPHAADAPGDPLEYISPSRLKSFLTCRMRFYIEKVRGIRAPASPALQVGKAVHAGLQRFHKAVWRGSDHATDVIVQQYRGDYEALEQEGPVDYEDGDEREKCIADGERVLRAYLDSEIAKEAAKAIGVEVALQSASLDLPLPLVGIIDLVRAGNEPVEFKTTGSTPNAELESWQHELQMVAYYMLLKDAVGEEPLPGKLVYLVKLKTPKVIVQQLAGVTQTQADRFRALVDVYVHAVEHGDYHPCVGMQCNWCPFKDRCAAWVGGNELVAA